jgi:hypothetical protein
MGHSILLKINFFYVTPSQLQHFIHGTAFPALKEAYASFSILN